jgi:YidC/Oxa1 family membrane protein insertase
MDNIRLFLWLTLLGMAWLAYTAWVADYGAAASRAETSPSAVAPQNGVPQSTVPTLTPSSEQPAPSPQVAAPAAAMGELIRVRTDVLDVRIASLGGDLVRADLTQYPVHKDMPEPVVRLLDDTGPERWVVQTGLTSAVGGAEPNHLATFRTASNEYSLAPGQDELVVTFDWVGDGPIGARKTYTFRRGRYEVDLTLTVMTTGGGSWRGAPYAQMERVHVPVERSYLSIDSYSFKGPVLYDGNEFEKLDVEELARTPEMKNVQGGWFASIQHHFLGAAVPPTTDTYRYDATMRGPTFLLSAVGPVTEVNAGMPLNATFKLFVGPKLQEQLQSVGRDLERTVD